MGEARDDDGPAATVVSCTCGFEGGGARVEAGLWQRPSDATYIEHAGYVVSIRAEPLGRRAGRWQQCDEPAAAGTSLPPPTPAAEAAAPPPPPPPPFPIHTIPFIPHHHPAPA